MTKMKLPHQADRRPNDLNISLAYHLRIALQNYAELYRATYGEAISLSELIPAILAEFLEADKAFTQKRDFAEPAFSATALMKEIKPKHSSAVETSERLVPLKEVCRLVGVGKSMVYKMIQQGRFPAPYKPSAGAARWSEQEVLDWISSVRFQRRASNAR